MYRIKGVLLCLVDVVIQIALSIAEFFTSRPPFKEVGELDEHEKRIAE